MRRRWYESNRLLRVFYHPLLLLDPSYREGKKLGSLYSWRSMSGKELGQALAQAERTIPKINPDSMIGRELEQSQVLDSILYWIAGDELKRKEYLYSPPRKTVMLRGSSGTGKTFFVKCVARRAFELLKQRGCPLFFFEITCGNLFSSWFGQSAKNLETELTKASTRPSLVFIDEIEAIATKVGELQQSADKENIRVVKTLLRKLDEMSSNAEMPTVVIAATNQYEKIPYDVRRRFGRPLDFDLGISQDMLLALVKGLLEKYRWRELEAEQVKSAIEDGVRSAGHLIVTPDDVAKTFEQVYEELKAKAASHAEIPQSAYPKASLEDFKRIARNIRSFAEEEKVEVIKNFAAKVRPKETLMDVGGLTGKKEEILKEISLSLNPHLTRALGIEPARGFLLYGPPGTGKTLLAKAVANETCATLYLVNAPELLQKFTGQSEQAVRDLFLEAKRNQPSMILIDEVDAIATARGLGGLSSLVNQFLSELDGMRGLEGVVVLATTNRPEILDPALLRPGRLTRQIEIPPPRNDEERLDIIEVHLRKIAPILSREVSAERVLELCRGRIQTPAELAQLVKDAATLWAKDLVARKQLLEALGNGRRRREVEQLYSRDLERMAGVLGVSRDVLADRLQAVDERSYKVSIQHIKWALQELLERSILQQSKAPMLIEKPGEPEVGKVNTILEIGENGALGTLAVVESVVLRDGGGEIEATGPGQKEIVEAAKQARVLLRQFVPKIKNSDIHIRLRTPPDLSAVKVNPNSLTLAVALAILSSYFKIPIQNETAVLGEVDLIAPGRVRAWPLKGIGRIAPVIENGISKLCLPETNYNELDSRDLEFFRKHAVDIVPVENFWKAVNEVFTMAPCVEKTPEDT